jgi:hypothetical protein
MDGGADGGRTAGGGSTTPTLLSDDLLSDTGAQMADEAVSSSSRRELRIVEVRLRHLPNPPPGLVTCNLYVTVENVSRKFARKVRVTSRMETVSYPRVYASDDLDGPGKVLGNDRHTYVSGTFTIDRNAPVLYSVDVRWHGGSTRRTDGGIPIYCTP